MGLVMACGTAAAAAHLLLPRHRRFWFFYRAKKPISFRSRLLISLWLVSWTVTAFVGFDTFAMLGPILLTVLVGISFTADDTEDAGDDEQRR